MALDLSGAAASHAAVGDPAGKIVTPLVILGIVMTSWALRPESRKLGVASADGIAPPWYEPRMEMYW